MLDRRCCARRSMAALLTKAFCILVLVGFMIIILRLNAESTNNVTHKNSQALGRREGDGPGIRPVVTVTKTVIASSDHSQKTEPAVTWDPLFKCTLADIEARPNFTLLTSTNTAFLDMTLNLLESIRRTKICVNITIIAEDEQAYHYLQTRAKADPGVHVLRTDSGDSTTKQLRWSTKAYNQFVNKRPRYLLSLLEQGLEVFFSDADTFWFRDPFPFFQGTFDAAMLDEKLNYPERNSKSVFCAGMAYFKPTQRTLDFVRTWVKILQESKKVVPDQNVMNILLKSDQPSPMDLRSLNPNMFPKGGLFYRDLWWQKHNETVVMHNSHVFGHDNKVKRFIFSNMWLVDKAILEALPKA